MDTLPCKHVDVLEKYQLDQEDLTFVSLSSLEASIAFIVS